MKFTGGGGGAIGVAPELWNLNFDKGAPKKMFCQKKVYLINRNSRAVKDSLIFKSLYLKKWNVSKKNLTANMLLYYLMLFLKPPLYKKYNSINMNKSLERSLILK